MGLLTAIITHLDAGAVRRQLAYLEELAPRSRFVICHGGSRRDFDELEIDDAVYVDDPSLRGVPEHQSYNRVLAAVNDRFVREDPTIDLVYLIEYDHLILGGDFERRLVEVAERTEAGLIAKTAAPRNNTNWTQFLRWRDDERLNRFVASISRRGEPDRLWGCLGSGMLFRRETLATLASLADPPHAYFELFIPTVVHHLGFDVADFDALSDLCLAVRYRPEYGVDEVLAEKRAGRTFVHPFKQLEALSRIGGTQAPPHQAETRASPGAPAGTARPAP